MGLSRIRWGEAANVRQPHGEKQTSVMSTMSTNKRGPASLHTDAAGRKQGTVQKADSCFSPNDRKLKRQIARGASSEHNLISGRDDAGKHPAPPERWRRAVGLHEAKGGMLDQKQWRG